MNEEITKHCVTCDAEGHTYLECPKLNFFDLVGATLGGNSFSTFETEAQLRARVERDAAALAASIAPAAPVQPIGYVKLIDTPFGKKLEPVLTVAVPVGAKLYTTPPAAPVVQAEIAELRRAIADDALAASFQSLGQYRSALLKAIETLKPAAPEKGQP